MLVRMEDIEVKLIFWEEFLHLEKYTWLWDIFWFGLVACFATGMVIYSRLIKPPGRTAEMLPPWRYCMFRNCLTDALSRRPAPFTPIKGRITHLYNCCNLIPQDWLMSQRWHRGSNPGPSGYKQDALTTGLSLLLLIYYMITLTFYLVLRCKKQFPNGV